MDWRNEGYLDEDAFERYLLREGVTEEQLEADLDDHLTLNRNCYNVDHQEFKINGERITVYAKGAVALNTTGGITIIEWLDNLPMELLMLLWDDETERNKIKGLMRYPGGYHEWLMLAAIPMLKVMEIPMAYVLEYRTPTAECCFFINDVQCWHGGMGSTTMHNDLFMEIGNAYLECAQRPVYHRRLVLRKYLRRFAERYYVNRVNEMPQALRNLIRIL